jgi:hypothetical protein
MMSRDRRCEGTGSSMLEVKQGHTSRFRASRIGHSENEGGGQREMVLNGGVSGGRQRVIVDADKALSTQST